MVKILKKYFIKFLPLFLAISVLFMYGCSTEKANYSKSIKTVKNEWKNSIYVPTQINNLNGTYFIVDCFHNRVIYNDNLTDDISKWKTMTDKINRGHTVASNGKIYVVDDTDNSSIRVFKRQNDGFVQSQIIDGIEGRPHYVMYDESTKYFYALCSQIGKMLILKDDSGTLKIVKSVTIPVIEKAYVRSFNIIDGYIYCVSGPDAIYKLKYDDMSFKVVVKYEVSKNLSGMNAIAKIDDYFYLSVMQTSSGDIAPKFVRTKSLESLINDDYEDLYGKFGFKDKPYFISHFNNKYFITEVGEINNSVKSFEVKNNEIKNIETLYNFKGFVKLE